MTAEVQEVIDQIVLIQESITPPDGLKSLRCYDEPPGHTVLNFPSLVNVESRIEDIDRGPSRRQQTLFVDMHLLLAQKDQKYSMRERRLWVQAILDKFDTELQLNGHASIATVRSVDFDSIELDTEYLGATFELGVLYTAAFAFAAGL